MINSANEIFIIVIKKVLKRKRKRDIGKTNSFSGRLIVTTLENLYSLRNL